MPLPSPTPHLCCIPALVVVAALSLGSGCTPETREPPPSPEGRSEAATAVVSDAPSAEAPAAAEPARDPHLEALLSGDRERTSEALARIRASKREHYSAPLIEMLPALSIGIVENVPPQELLETLEAVSGQAFGDDWPAWMRWLAAEPLGTPPGFTGWKGRLFSRIDRRFGALLAYGIPSRIRSEEIVWGGVAYEGIPALDSPQTISAARADELGELRNEDAVFGVALDGAARAYPLRILDWHEMANDRVADTPIALAYCTLCGSGIVFERVGPDGALLEFGSSGLLMRSNKLMVDRETHSLWNQFTGQPVVGPLAEQEFALRTLPSVVTTWGRWKQRHPETDVVSFATGHARNYSTGAAYAEYFASADPMFPIPERLAGVPGGSAVENLPAKSRIVGVERKGGKLVLPLEVLLRERVRNDAVGGEGVVLVTSSDAVEIRGQSLRAGIPREYSAGAEVRVYLRGEHRFARSPNEPSAGSNEALVDEAGTRWRLEESALVAEDGRRLGTRALDPRLSIRLDVLPLTPLRPQAALREPAGAPGSALHKCREA